MLLSRASLFFVALPITLASWFTFANGYDYYSSVSFEDAFIEKEKYDQHSYRVMVKIYNDGRSSVYVSGEPQTTTLLGSIGSGKTIPLKSVSIASGEYADFSTSHLLLLVQGKNLEKIDEFHAPVPIRIMDYSFSFMADTPRNLIKNLG